MMTRKQPRTASMDDAVIFPDSYQRRSNHHLTSTRRELNGRVSQDAQYFCYRGPHIGWEILPFDIQCRLQAIDAEAWEYFIPEDTALYNHKKFWQEDLDDTGAPCEYRVVVRIDFDESKMKKSITFDSREIRYASGERCQVRKLRTLPDKTTKDNWQQPRFSSGPP